MADEYDLICVACEHPEDEHVKSWGSGHCNHKVGSYSRQCTCSGFIRPSPQQQKSGYRRPKQKTGFQFASSRNEIGNGTSRTANLQGHRLTNLGGGGEKGEVAKTPEWVMLGIKNVDGSVTIFASTKLSYVSLQQEARGEFEKIHSQMIEDGILEDKAWNLRGRMVGYVAAHAATYAEAMRRLMDKGWSPDGPGEPSTADLQRQAALEDAEREDREAQERQARPALPPAEPDDEIFDAELVEDDE